MSEYPSNFKTPEGEAKYITAYETTLTLWGTPYAFLEVSTPWGRTHIIASGPKDAPPLILLHGMHLSATMWFSNVIDLSRNYRVYAVDTIGGVGRSVAIHPLKSRADLAGWLSETLDSLGIIQPHVLGHSYGGWLALNFALSMPERVSRLILLAPVGLQPLVSQFWLRGIPLMLWPRRSFVASFMKWMTVAGVAINELFVEQFVTGIQNFRPRPHIRVLPAKFTDEELRQIKVHTLLLIGEEEVIYKKPKAAAKRANQLIQNIEVEVISNASHGLPIERPALVNERISGFLNQEQEAV